MMSNDKFEKLIQKHKSEVQKEFPQADPAYIRTEAHVRAIREKNKN